MVVVVKSVPGRKPGARLAQCGTPSHPNFPPAPFPSRCSTANNQAQRLWSEARRLRGDGKAKAGNSQCDSRSSSLQCMGSRFRVHRFTRPSTMVCPLLPSTYVNSLSVMLTILSASFCPTVKMSVLLVLSMVAER